MAGSINVYYARIHPYELKVEHYHIQQCHINQGAVFNERTILLCKKGCHQRGHFHCCCCEKVYVKKKDLFSHLNKDLILPVNKRVKVDIVADVVSDIVEAGTSVRGGKYAECSQCNHEMLRKNLKTHVVRKHTNRQHDITLNRYHVGHKLINQKDFSLYAMQ